MPDSNDLTDKTGLFVDEAAEDAGDEVLSLFGKTEGRHLRVLLRVLTGENLAGTLLISKHFSRAVEHNVNIVIHQLLKFITMTYRLQWKVFLSTKMVLPSP